MNAIAIEAIIDAVMAKPTQSPDRLGALADFLISELALHGLPGATGLSPTGTRSSMRSFRN